MQYFPLSFKWISDTVARLPNWHNRQDVCLAKSVYLARQYCRCRNKILVFKNKFLWLTSCPWTSCKQELFFFSLQSCTRTALIYLPITFCYRNRFHLKPFFSCSFSCQTAFLLLPHRTGWQMILWINFKPVHYSVTTWVLHSGIFQGLIQNGILQNLTYVLA